MHIITVQIHGGEYTPSQPPHPAMSLYHTHPRSTHTTYIADRNTRQLHDGQACAAPPASVSRKHPPSHLYSSWQSNNQATQPPVHHPRSKPHYVTSCSRLSQPPPWLLNPGSPSCTAKQPGASCSRSSSFHCCRWPLAARTATDAKRRRGRMPPLFLLLLLLRSALLLSSVLPSALLLLLLLGYHT